MGESYENHISSKKVDALLCAAKDAVSHWHVLCTSQRCMRQNALLYR